MVYVDKPPKWKGDLPRLIFRKKIDLHAFRNTSQLESGVIDQVIREDYLELSNQDRYINTRSYMCNEDGCLIKVGPSLEKTITALDNEHLTPAASDFFVKAALIDAITSK